MNWDFYIKQFQSYLQLERSLSENSVEAYIHDAVKLKQFAEISNLPPDPTKLKTIDIQNFLVWIGKYSGEPPYRESSTRANYCAQYYYDCYQFIHI